MKAPEQTLAMRRARPAAARTKPRVSEQAEAPRVPQPPATISVSSGSSDSASATSCTPDELVTGPAARANTRNRYAGGAASRLAASNTVIGPAASSSWNSGKIRTPIVRGMALKEGNRSFKPDPIHPMIRRQRCGGGLDEREEIDGRVRAFPGRDAA